MSRLLSLATDVDAIENLVDDMFRRAAMVEREEASPIEFDIFGDDEESDRMEGAEGMDHESDKEYRIRVGLEGCGALFDKGHPQRVQKMAPHLIKFLNSLLPTQLYEEMVSICR